MCIIFQISVKSSECWQAAVLGLSCQSKILLSRKVGTREQALAFLSRLFPRSHLALSLSDVEYRLMGLAPARLVVLYLQA